MDKKIIVTPEEIAEAKRVKAREYYHKNKARLDAYNAKWKKERPEKTREYRERYFERLAMRMKQENENALRHDRKAGVEGSQTERQGNVGGDWQ